jgi:hypothetical protein
MLQAIHAACAPERRPVELNRRSVHGVVHRMRPRVLAHVATDVRGRLHNTADTTQFLPSHYALLLSSIPELWPGAHSVPVGLTEMVADELEGVPQCWPTRHLVSVVTACAEEELPAHRLFSVAARVVTERMEAAAARGEEGRVTSVCRMSLVEAESLLWAFAVTRRIYPFSARLVSCAAATFLEREMLDVPGSVQTAVLADMLWSFAAMSHTPTSLFELAYGALEDPERELDGSAAESLEWSYHRAGMLAPARVLALARGRSGGDGD